MKKQFPTTKSALGAANYATRSWPASPRRRSLMSGVAAAGVMIGLPKESDALARH